MSTVGNLDAVSLTSCNSGSIMHDTICGLCGMRISFKYRFYKAIKC